MSNDIAPLDSAFMQMRCVHCATSRYQHMLGVRAMMDHCDSFEPVDLPRREQHVPVRREGRVL